MSPGQTGHITGQMGRVPGTDGTHTRGCPAKILYVYWFFLSPLNLINGTPPNRTRTKEFPLWELRGGCLASWVPKWESKLGSGVAPANQTKKSQFMNFSQRHSGTKVQCESCLFS